MVRAVLVLVGPKPKQLGRKYYVAICRKKVCAADATSLSEVPCIEAQDNGKKFYFGLTAEFLCNTPRSVRSFKCHAVTFQVVLCECYSCWSKLLRSI